MGGKVRFAAFTGKAAMVMRSKGCNGATTIHKLIYLPKDKSHARLKELQRSMELETAKVPQDSQALEALQWQINRERKALRAPCFAINEESEMQHMDLVVIDEVSMVDGRMADDLMSFHIKLLVLGDPAQLPPVAGAGYFTNQEPDFLLTEVHRQAANSPVLQMATDVREGRRLSLGSYGSSRVVPKGTLSTHQIAEFDQILVGRNHTRKVVNRRIREEVLGRKSHLPEPGDRLVCLRNDHMAGMLNGSQWDTLECEEVDEDTMCLTIQDSENESNVTTLLAHRHTFEDRDLSPWEVKEAMQFDFSYALTVHKAQGSQWSNVMIIDESGCFRQDSKKWMYTALTRASESVTVVQ